MKLNDRQLEAVNHDKGPCLVLAGAGSGKTRVLTERIVRLVESGVSPYQILAITFTNKAANEMRERVRLRIGDITDSIFIGTFHSFGLKIVRENYKGLDYKSNITIIDREDMTSIIKKIMKDNGLDPQKYDIKYIINKISFAKNEGLSVTEFSDLFKSNVDQIVSLVYENYIKRLRENNSVDFDDLLTLPVEIFKKNRSVLEKYQNIYEYILVDEYQDTNSVQYELCKILSMKNKNIFVVGDIDQSIYGWRYANYENVLSFEKDYKDTKVILLEENYRSTKNILDAANSLIKNNKQRKEKNLWSTNEEGMKLQYIRCEDEKEEAKTVVSKLKNLISEGYTFSDFSVLYRTNAQSRALEEEFLRENIPYKVVGSYFFYNRKEIKDLIAYLTLIYNKSDSLSLERVINVPKRGIGEKSIENLRIKANIENVSMFDAIDSGKELEFKNIILDLIEQSKNLSLSELIDAVLDKTKIKQELEESDSLDSDIRLENLEEFKSVAVTFEEKGIYNLEDFLENIALVSDAGQYKSVEDAATLMTLHSAKGLEFDVVFLVGMEEGIFPHMRSFENENEMEEERRLAYVGITRARKILYMLNAKRRLLFGKTTVNLPSRFISEIKEELIESNEIKKENANIFFDNMYDDDVNTELKAGDKVYHEVFKEGIVISIDGSIAKIAFSHQFGIKQIAKNHKSLKKM
jgi:DNA helicase-2/ATP-dependent DNA helicase PcrA